MSAAANKQLVRKFFEEFSAGKIEDALAMLADGATWWVAGSFPLSGTMTKAEFLELSNQLGPMMPNGLRLTPTAFTAEGDRVAVEATSYAKMASGKTYNNEYHFLFEVRGGQIQALREYFDTMHANDVFCGDDQTQKNDLGNRCSG